MCLIIGHVKFDHMIKATLVQFLHCKNCDQEVISRILRMCILLLVFHLVALIFIADICPNHTLLLLRVSFYIYLLTVFCKVQLSLLPSLRGKMFVIVVVIYIRISPDLLNYGALPLPDCSWG